MSELLWINPKMGCGSDQQVMWTFDLRFPHHVRILQFWLDELREFNQQNDGERDE